MAVDYLYYRFDRPDGRKAYNLYCADDCQTLPRKFRQLSTSTDLVGETPSVQAFEDVVLAGENRNACLFHADGRLVDVSRSPPRSARDAQDFSDNWVDGPRFDLGAMAVIEEPVVFQGVFYGHWGHFLLESCARSWAAIVDPALAELPGIYGWPPNPGWSGPPYADFLQANGVRLRRRGWGGPALRLAKCFVPTVSFAIQRFAHPHHALTPQRVASRLLTTSRREAAPVYLSRAKLALDPALNRIIANEPELERRLAECGVRIVHMETLSLAEQIEVMNSHSVFIGPWGSALHNILFCLHGREASTFVLIEEFCPINLLLVDDVVGNDAHYIHVLRTLEETAECAWTQVDIDILLTYLRRCGVV